MTGMRMLVAFSLALVLAAPAAAQGNAWPARPVRVIATNPPGGSVDRLARTLSEELARATGQPFVVENRSGANGDIGAEQLMAAPADGHALLVSPSGPFVINMHLRRQSFDPGRDLQPVTLLGVPPLVLVVHPSVPARSLAELLDWARSRGALNYASQGMASSGHLAMELLRSRAGFDALHVPYKGAAGASADVVAGHVPMMFDNTGSALPQVAAGRLRAIAVAEGARLASAPDIPTVAEQGFPGFEATPWIGLSARAGLPAAVVQRLASEWSRAAARPELRERYSRIGVELRSVSGEALAGFIATDRARWGAIIRSAGVTNE